jgi:NAD(P)H-nitrite reductase large subunit
MATRKALRTEYLIIGNSAGGIGAVEAIREIDKKSSITIVSDESYPAYSRPLISEYLSCERTVDEMLFRPADFYHRNNIDLMLGKTVKNLDLPGRLVELEGGEKIAWNKLLLATGGVPIVPKIKGSNKKGVFKFLALDDAKAIDKFLKDYSRAVVIGGGLIGVSVSEALTKRDVSVTIVEMKDRVLNTILDERASAIAQEMLAEAGIRVIVNDTVSEVVGEKSVEGVVLDSGERIPCDLVVIAIGVLPRTELVQGSDIKVNRGIVVDRYMATSYPDVYACGDVAEAYDFVLGTNRLTPIWPNAYIGGRVAGYNMAGVKKEYPGGTAMNSVNYFGLDVATAGVVNPPDGSYEVIYRDKDGIYQKVILSDGQIVGMVFVKDIEKSGMIFGLMRDKVDVGSFKQALLTDDFGLAYLPQELWRERLGNVSLLVAKG